MIISSDLFINTLILWGTNALEVRSCDSFNTIPLLQILLVCIGMTPGQTNGIHCKHFFKKVYH